MPTVYPAGVGWMQPLSQIRLSHGSIPSFWVAHSSIRRVVEIRYRIGSSASPS